MLSGSAFLRVVILMIVAAGLASLVQIYWSPATVDSDPAPVTVTPEPSRPVRRADPAPVSSVPPVPVQPTPQGPVPQGPVVQAVPTAPAAASPPLFPSAAFPSASPPAGQAPTGQAPTGQARADQAPAGQPPAPYAPLTFERSTTAGEEEVERASDTAGPRAMAIVDLNTASVADLNGLKGGGMIGRSIVQKRPYASVDQLLSKRVLSRATYERIKDQVTVR